MRVPIGGIGLLFLLLAAPALRADAPAGLERAIRDYLLAAPAKRKAALDRAVALAKDDVAAVATVLRALPPLETKDDAPGAHHRVAFASGGAAWEASVLKTKGYDGKRRYPVLLLPDHGAVDAEAGIGFWEGKDGSDEYVVFRPVITKHQEDAKRVPQKDAAARDAALARVMADALAMLRLRYAVDEDRVVATGLSQAGYYAWFYAVTMPDQFAGIVPESAGGGAVRGGVLPLARNVVGLRVRILHTEGDQICPYADAVAMRDAVKAAGGEVELITYRDADYPGAPFPKRHPGPHLLRLQNVLPWATGPKRTIPTSFTRVIRYGNQGFEGRWRLPAPDSPREGYVLTCEEKGDGTLTCDRAGAVYLPSLEDVAAGRVFRAGGKEVRAKPDVRLLLETFLATGDRGRLVAGEIAVPRS